MRTHLLASISLALLGSLHSPAHAVTVQVINGDDSGPGSLRDAITLVNGGSDVENQIVFTSAFPQGMFIELLSTLPPINRPIVEVLGFGRPQLEAINISNSFTYITAGPLLQSLRLQGMRMNFGRASLAGSNGGGCVSSGTLQTAASLLLEDMEFVGCAAVNSGFARGGAVYWERGPVTVRRSSFDSNSATSTGSSQASGGAIYAAANLIVERSEFANNIVNGRFAGGGALLARSGLTVSDSRFISNSAGTDGSGGSFALGGAVSLDSLSTFSGRIERSYFGVNGETGNLSGGALFARGNGTALALVLSNVSFDGNQATDGGGMTLTNVALDAEHLTFSANRGTPAHVNSFTTLAQSFRNSVFATSTTNGCAFQNNASGSGNLTSDASCTNRLPGATQITGLAPITTASFPSMSVVRFATASAVVDNAAITQCAAIDARGTARPQDGNDDGTARCDAGAFEHPGNRVFRGGFEAGG